MALFQCDFNSEILGLKTSMNVIIPQAAAQKARSLGKRLPVLYLLHGYSDDQYGWCRSTSLERYAERYDLAIIMPYAYNSYYTDMVHGLRYFSFVSEELPSLVQAFFPVSGAREDTFVAGNSMGGYGAFKLALSYPDRYAAAASLSGLMDLRSSGNAGTKLFYTIFGGTENLTGTSDDLRVLAERTGNSSESQPLLYQLCGTEDYLYKCNIEFLEYSKDIGLDIRFLEEPGSHDWDFWDRNIQRVLEWLPIRQQLKQD